MTKPVVGVVGLGKLGLPFAATLAAHGHRVYGYDLDSNRMSLDALPDYELSQDLTRPLRDALHNDIDLRFRPLADVISYSDCVFVAVETPHGPLYEGITPLPETRSDFSYEILENALAMVAAEVSRTYSAPLEIGVISTVLPGTVRKRLLPLLGGCPFIYCPQFIAMGTVARDLHHPEFILLGRQDSQPSCVKAVLQGLTWPPATLFEVSYESAELAKVTYNTFISAKVAAANTVQRLADGTGAISSEVYRVLRAGSRRLTSPSYLGPGMGDGGPCHPRDNIALSWLAENLGIPHDFFTALMQQREEFTRWQAEVFIKEAEDLPLILLGTAYKPGVPLETGSSSVLLANLLQSQGHTLTIVHSGDDIPDFSQPSAFFLGCPDEPFLTMSFPEGSVVIDPWHKLKNSTAKVIHMGEARL